MKHFTRLIPAAVLGWMLIAGSCERSGVEPSGDGFDFSSGVFILCEGQFQATNASLSFYYPQPDSVSNHIFSRVNGVPLGDVANSLLLSGGNDAGFRGDLAEICRDRQTTGHGRHG